MIRFRPELASAPENFFRVLDKAKDPRKQRLIVEESIGDLIRADMSSLVIPLVEALGERTFRGENLKDIAIIRAFNRGASKGVQSIVEAFFDHPIILSWRYGMGLINAWNEGDPSSVFKYLLDHVEMDDLNSVKEEKEYGRGIS